MMKAFLVARAVAGVKCSLRSLKERGVIFSVKISMKSAVRV